MDDLGPGASPTRPTRKNFDPRFRAAVRAAVVRFESGNAAAAYQSALPLAEAGDHEAQRLIGVMFASGALGKADLIAARSWWERAGWSGDPAAQFNAGLSYLDSDAGATNTALARAWLTEAANGGHVGAMQRLGELDLSEAGDDLARAGEGYAWLQVACLTGGLSARMALGRALQASPWNDPSRLDALQAEALRHTVAYRNTTGPDLLQQADRDPSRSAFVTFQLCQIAGDQGLVQNAHAAHPSIPSPATLPVVARKTSREIAERAGTLMPAATAVWALARRGISYAHPDVVSLPAARLWDVVRPGDTVEIADGVNAHVTFAWSIDRGAGLMRVIDVWPDEFLLLPGLNALGIEATIEPYGRTRKLLCFTRDDFLQSVRGVAGLVGMRSIATLWQSAPELQTDSAAGLALASIVAALPDAEASSRGLGWLISLLRTSVPPLTSSEAAYAADRAWLAAERVLAANPRSTIACVSPASRGNLERVAGVLEDLRRRWPPRFETLTPRTLADAVWRRAATPAEATFARSWWSRPAARQAIDPIQRADAAGAEALLERALQCYPDNELLGFVRATRRMDRGEAEAALREISTAIATMETKRTHAGPLVRDLDGDEVGVASERRTFARYEASALAVKARALMALHLPQEAVAAIENALALIEGDDLDLLTGLVEAATASGNTSKAEAAQSRLDEMKARTMVDRVLR